MVRGTRSNLRLKISDGRITLLLSWCAMQSQILRDQLMHEFNLNRNDK